MLPTATEAQKKKLKSEHQSFIEDRNGKLSAKAFQLHCEVGVLTESGCGVAELEKFQAYYSEKNVQLRVFVADSRTNAKSDVLPVFYEGEAQEKCVNLFLHKSHYSTIINLQAFHGAVRYCTKCRKAYTDELCHRKCNLFCNCCFSHFGCLVA